MPQIMKYSAKDNASGQESDRHAFSNCTCKSHDIAYTVVCLDFRLLRLTEFPESPVDTEAEYSSATFIVVVLDEIVVADRAAAHSSGMEYIVNSYGYTQMRFGEISRYREFSIRLNFQARCLH